MRIGLIGLFGSGNTGNDGSLEAMLGILRRLRPDAELMCFCGCNSEAPDRVARDFRVAALPLAFLRPAHGPLRLLDTLTLSAPRQLASLVRALVYAARLNVLIIPGTGVLGVFRDRPFGMPLALFGWCLAASLFGTRIAFVSVGAGPIDRPFTRWLMKSAAALACYRSYRDTGSREFMASLGLNTRADAVYPDLAFALPSPPAGRAASGDDGSLTVGVGVMTYIGWRMDTSDGLQIYQAYLEKITSFVLWLLDCGHRVRILMGDIVDKPAVADLVAKVNAARTALEPGRMVADPIRSLHDLMCQMAELDVIVATRFHNVVCALKCGKPTVSIGYADKNDSLMAEMGVGQFCQHIERLDLDVLIRQFNALVVQRARHEASIRNANHAFRQRLKRQDRELAANVLGAQPALSYAAPAETREHLG
jgi:polysaccharide pyruvyl transferase WcaK-like protein